MTVIKAEATQKSEQMRGEGEAERNRIFAEAFGSDPDFFRFYRSMQAYDAGAEAGRHAHAAVAGQRVLPLLQGPERQAPPAAPQPSRSDERSSLAALG